ncbi:hypothetical protein E2C01_009998 [Portunus trituberculatus]|uniref:Uncharacterized protein n=1 Tax=Portunus trituberculatus TaxID=210409 RepID=A0A5B7D773_PORTR|nr:hypothetical protein [Portunus trituberculatus]
MTPSPHRGSAGAEISDVLRRLANSAVLRRELPGAAGSAGRGVLVHAASPLLEAVAEAAADELLFYDSTSVFCPWVLPVEGSSKGVGRRGKVDRLREYRPTATRTPQHEAD